MDRVFLYNTLSRSKEEFVPISAGKVGMYTCGPTVYNYAHIGNLRTYIFEDVLKKTLRLAGYEVRHVMNITDVGHLTGDGDDGDDKVSKAAERERKSIGEIVSFYTNCFLDDERRLNVDRADIVCKATDHIPEMLALIKRLEENGHTYSAGGNVYFSIDTFPDYGKLANLKDVDLRAGERVAVDGAKRNPHDFVLWFTKSKFGNQAMKWDSDYGTGYPGWHLECSAMSMKYLGEHFDIHCGGIDAVPVHHTNEIAQSEGATGKKWVNYWMHGEFLLSEKGKMSKSSGEFTTLSLLEKKGFMPLSYRYFCLQAHYRKQLQFSYDSLRAAETALKGLYARIDALKREARAETGESSEDYLAARSEFRASLYDDLGTPGALSALHSALTSAKLTASEKLRFASEADSVLSLGLCDERKADSDFPEEVVKLAEERLCAKKAKDWATADAIRGRIASLGYAVKDVPGGGYELSEA